MMATLLATGVHLLLCVDTFLHVTPDLVDCGFSKNVQNQIRIAAPPLPLLLFVLATETTLYWHGCWGPRNMSSINRYIDK